MQKVRVGVVGLGEVGQITHLPILQALGDRYEIGALCDISCELLRSQGERYSVEKRYTDAGELATQDDLDAVFVLNSDEYHAECTIAALEHGKHVLVEKPMCLTDAEADAIIAARDRAGKVVMVAYMRRYAPAFLRAVEEVHSLGNIRYARVRDIIGQNRLIIDQSSIVHRPNDIPRDAIQDKQQRAERLGREAIGDRHEEFGGVYRLLCGLSSHDLSAMRELLGMPERVLGAAVSERGRFISVIFGYPGYNVMFETGTDSQRRFDAHIEVYGDSKSVRVQYDTPYIRHLPTTLTVTQTVGEAYTEVVERPTYTDPYSRELEYFHEVVTTGGQPKTTPEDFKQDLQLFRMIIDSLSERSTDNIAHDTEPPQQEPTADFWYTNSDDRAALRKKAPKAEQLNYLWYLWDQHNVLLNKQGQPARDEHGHFKEKLNNDPGKLNDAELERATGLRSQTVRRYIERYKKTGERDDRAPGAGQGNRWNH